MTLINPPTYIKRATIWITLYIAGCIMIGLIIGITWGIITPLIAGGLS